MLDTPDYRVTEAGWVRDFLARRPWMALVAATSSGPVVTHMPVILETAGEDGALVLATHVGKPDDEALELADGQEILVVVEGEYGYISPGWYAWGPAVPTWNYQALHLRTRVELLDAAATWKVLVRTIDRFEQERPEPFRLSRHSAAGTDDLGYGHRIANDVVGIRLHVLGWQGKNKMSQDKPAAVVERIIAGLSRDGDPHRHPRLAAEMRLAHGLGPAADTVPGTPTEPAARPGGAP